ncbi:MAG: amino acid adenylation domain-containing protein, partial [Lysobacteraceae bacterium]
MVPAAYVQLERMPLSSNGKLDRRGLPAPGEEAYVRGCYEAPQGPFEEAIARIWGQVLKRDRVGRGDDFFQLGGHSLLAVSVMARLREHFELELSLTDLFQHSRLQSLAERIEAAREADEVLRIPAITAVTDEARREGLPLSFAQQRLWFLSQLSGQSQAYHIPIGLRLEGPLDVSALRRSLDHLLHRHQVMRSRIELRGGEAVQCVGEDTGFGLQELDLRAFAAEEQQQRVDALVREHQGAAFDLSRGPLVRGLLLRRGDARYELHLVQHHIVSDGWSMGIFTSELSVLYAAYVGGCEDASGQLPALPIQYGDYAAWQRRWLDAEALKAQSRYWWEHLQGAPELLALPTDFPRPAQQDLHGGLVRIELGRSLSRGLQALSQAQGCTLHQTLLSAWAVVLAKLSGQRDIVIGTPSANRDQGQLHGLIGFFVNTLPLRLRLDENPSVQELMRHAREVAVAGQERQQLPFEQIVEILKPARRLSHSPVFQVLFTWQNNDVGVLDFPGLKIGMVDVFEAVAKYDLELTLWEGEEGIEGDLGYATALFDEASIRRHAQYLQRVLAAYVAAHESGCLGQTRFAQLELLSAEERMQLMEGFNPAEEPYPSGCLHTLFEARVREHPEALALAYGEERLSYETLNRRANQVAHALIGQGVRPDDRVAICVHRGVEMVVGVLGILKSGAAYVPLDPGYPEARLSHMVLDSGPRAMVSDGRVDGGLIERLLAGAGDRAPSLLMLDADAALWRSGNTGNPDPEELGLRPEHLAYVIYTSGSTGTPKGVMISHGNACNFLHWTGCAFEKTELSCVVWSTSLNFDLAVYECFAPLIQGGYIHLVENVLALRSQSTPSCLINAVPSAVKSLLGSGHFPDSVQTVNLAGEPLPESLVAALFAQTQVQRVCNLYGPTETTTYSTWISMRREDGFDSSIGHPIANTRIYLLDEDCRPVPLGVVGEIYIGGAGVARGYLNRPELTAERFVEDPYSGRAGARMYRTGDLGRYRADGAIEFLGRNDFQVKVRGFRIELGEIEARLVQCAGVDEAVVVSHGMGDAGPQLVAYVTGRSGGALDAEVLRSELRKGLPEHMVPAAYVQLERMPLSSNGKLDRRGLPAPGEEAYVRGCYEAPQGPFEEAIARIWGQVLKRDRVGRGDDFFQLGGHSLLAVSVMARLREAGLQVEVSDLFGGTTLAALAARAARTGVPAQIPANLIAVDCARLTPELLSLVSLSQAQIDQIVSQVPGGAANVQDIYPLAPLQEGIFFHYLLEQQGDVYITPMLFEFDARVRLDRYVEALNAVIQRHDVLRTAMHWEGLEAPVQVVQRKAELILHEEVADTGDARGAAAQLQTRFDPHRYRMDLRRAPLLELHAMEDVSSGRWSMLMLSHHLWGDHASLEALIREIAAHLSGQQADLPEPVPFRNFVAQARRGLSTGEHEAFFKTLLGGVSEPTLPYGLADVQRTGGDVRECRWPLPAGLSRGVRECARRHGVSVASVFHLAWAQVLAKLSGREDVVFGTGLLGRMQGGEVSEHGMGLFINTLPLRVNLAGQGAAAALGQTHQSLAHLLRHEHASLALAQRCSGVEAPMPLFSALLNYRHSPMGEVWADAEQMPEALQGVRVVGGHERSNYPVALNVDDYGVDADEDAGFGLNPQIVSPYAPERVAGYMQCALEQLLAALEQAPETPVGGLSILPEAERMQLIEGFNPAEEPYPSGCLHTLFEARVREHPEALALAYGEERLSYEALNRRANQVAHALIGQGVRPDDRVAICVHRGVEMVVGVLGILKSGAAYVPLDPGYPEARLSHMVLDSGPRAMVSDGRVDGGLIERLLAGAGDRAPSLLMLDADAALWRSGNTGNPDPEELGLRPEHLAYVIYTSGSTGTPKGVM